MPAPRSRPAGAPGRPWFPTPATEPIPLAMDDLSRWMRTPRGVAAAATFAGVMLALGVGLTTSPPAGVVDLAAAGADAPPDVRLQLTAPATDLVEVTDVKASVDAASLPAGCPPGAVHVDAPAGPLTITNRAGIPVEVTLSTLAPAACRGAMVTIAGDVAAVGPGGQVVHLAASAMTVLT